MFELDTFSSFIFCLDSGTTCESPWYVQFVWCLYNLNNVVSLTVSLSYYTLLSVGKSNLIHVYMQVFLHIHAYSREIVRQNCSPININAPPPPFFTNLSTKIIAPFQILSTGRFQPYLVHSIFCFHYMYQPLMILDFFNECNVCHFNLRYMQCLNIRAYVQIHRKRLKFLTQKKISSYEFEKSHAQQMQIYIIEAQTTL